MSNPFEGGDGPPNLDDFSADPDDFFKAASVFERYAKYLEHKAHAMKLRAGGSAQHAAEREAMAQFYYDDLPDWAKW